MYQELSDSWLKPEFFLNTVRIRKLNKSGFQIVKVSLNFWFEWQSENPTENRPLKAPKIRHNCPVFSSWLEKLDQNLINDMNTHTLHTVFEWQSCNLSFKTVLAACSQETTIRFDEWHEGLFRNRASSQLHHSMLLFSTGTFSSVSCLFQKAYEMFSWGVCSTGTN